MIADALARSRAQWTEAAGTWDREGDLIGQSTRAVTEALVAAAGIRPGMRVLDVAGGTGDPTMRLLSLLGPAGRVVCTDLTPAMLAAARRRVGSPERACFAAGSAEALPFPAATFDAVVSRFGVMLFADPAAGVREMARVTRPGGVIAAAVWGAPERNPYLAIAMGVVARLARDVPPPDPAAPGVFRLAGPGQLAALFTAAGARDVRDGRLDFVMEAPIGLDEFWPFLLRLAAPMRALVAAQAPDVQREMAAAVRRDVAPYFRERAMRFPAEMVVVRALSPTGP
jgi:SAM-dependent methyltransferase